MQTIPSTLLDKLRQNFQTFDNNADPKMDVIAQKMSKYITEGNTLRPRTIRTGNSLNPLDICIRREVLTQDPSEIFMVYIEDGVAKVATLPYVYTPDQEFEYQYTLGIASDVACDFDGRFELVRDHTGIFFDTDIIWALVTFDEPWIAMVTNGALTVRKGFGAPYTLAEENITKCVIIRGLKSTTDILTDQGMVCAYLKTDGAVYYRNYCEQEDGSYIWEIERQITDFVGTVTNIGIFRTGDYRLGFLAEISGEIHILLTDRSWSGMAILPEYIDVETSMTVDVYEIDYIDVTDGDEYISASADMSVSVKWGLAPEILIVENIADGDDDWGFLVRITFDSDISSVAGNASQFLMTDLYSSGYYCTAISQESARSIILTFEDFNSASMPLTLDYTPGTISGEVELLAAFSEEFEATNLVPVILDPPVPLSIENIEEWSVT